MRRRQRVLFLDLLVSGVGLGQNVVIGVQLPGDRPAGRIVEHQRHVGGDAQLQLELVLGVGHVLVVLQDGVAGIEQGAGNLHDLQRRDLAAFLEALEELERLLQVADVLGIDGQVELTVERRQVAAELAGHVGAGDAQGGQRRDGRVAGDADRRLQRRGRYRAQGDGQVELPAVAGVRADVVDKGALDLGERLQGDSPAAAAQQRLHDVEVHGRDAGGVRADAEEIDDGVVGEGGGEQGAGAEQLAEAASRADVPVVGVAQRRQRAGPVAHGVLGGGELVDEAEALQRHRQGVQIQILADELVFAAVDETEFDGLVELEQEAGALGIQGQVKDGLQGRPGDVGGVGGPGGAILLALLAVLAVPDLEHFHIGGAVHVADARGVGLLRVRRDAVGVVVIGRHRRPIRVGRVGEAGALVRVNVVLFDLPQQRRLLVLFGQDVVNFLVLALAVVGARTAAQDDEDQREQRQAEQITAQGEKLARLGG